MTLDLSIDLATVDATLASADVAQINEAVLACAFGETEDRALSDAPWVNNARAFLAAYTPVLVALREEGSFPLDAKSFAARLSIDPVQRLAWGMAGDAPLGESVTHDLQSYLRQLPGYDKDRFLHTNQPQVDDCLAWHGYITAPIHEGITELLNSRAA